MYFYISNNEKESSHSKAIESLAISVALLINEILKKNVKTMLHYQLHNPNIILKKYLYGKVAFKNKQSATILRKLMLLVCVN